MKNLRGFIIALGIVAALLFFNSLVYAQFPSFTWAERAGGADYYDRGHGIARDELGNSCVTGYFYSTATFGAVELTSDGQADIYLHREV